MTAHPEHDLQVKVNQCVRECINARHFFCSIDRAEKRSRFDHIRQKNAGFVSGTPDTLLLVPGVTAIAIELKARGKKVDPGSNQELVGHAIRGAGHFWNWCDSVLGYMELLNQAGVPLRGNWRLIAAGHDIVLESAAIRRKEAKTGAPSKKRLYKRWEEKPAPAKLKAVARIRAAGVRI